MIKKIIALVGLTLSLTANAGIVTHGHLSHDDTTNIIADSLNNVEYLRFDAIADLNYSQTLAVLDTQDGGGWDIASYAEAAGFMQALISNSPPYPGPFGCSSDFSTNWSCRTYVDWADGDFGDSHFSANSDMAFVQGQNGFGYVRLNEIGSRDFSVMELVVDPGFNTSYTDSFSSNGIYYDYSIGYMLVRPSEVAPECREFPGGGQTGGEFPGGGNTNGCFPGGGNASVPEPGTLPLLALGLAGLVGIRKFRKSQSINS